VRLLLLGPPGSGKGTQGERLAAALDIPHVAAGDIVRDHIARCTPFGRQVEAAIAKGNFAPDDDMLYWVQQRLGTLDAQRGYILDGFPRDLAQAQEFDAKSPKRRVFDVVLELIVHNAVLTERLAGRLVCPVCNRVYHVVYCPPQKAGVCDYEGSPLIRRPDDMPEAIRRRFEVYETLTMPLRRYYAAQNVLRTVEAEGDPDDVAQRLVRSLSERASGPKSALFGV
jgi:adenylate kinase